MRADPFSTHRAGFEIRTYRLCKRVLMFHHFPDERDDWSTPCPIDPLPLPRADRIRCASRALRLHRARAGGTAGISAARGGYVSRQMPPLNFTYSQPVVDDTLCFIEPDQLENLPLGTQGPGYQWIDLDGEGLPGVLSEQMGAWHYKPNLGDGASVPAASCASCRRGRRTRPEAAQLMDVEGNGALELVSLQEAHRLS